MEIEKRLNVKFPREYIDFLCLKEDLNKKFSILFNDETIIINKFLCLDQENDDSIEQVYREYRDMMLEDIIPIAETEDNDYICLYYDINRESSPKVILWNYELALDQFGEGIFVIADCFKDFKDKLVII